MFKKSLAAVALLGAFAGSAFAADVTLYGVVDEGFLYTHKDADKTGVDAVDKLELKTEEWYSGRFPLGSEGH